MMTLRSWKDILKRSRVLLTLVRVFRQSLKKALLLRGRSSTEDLKAHREIEPVESATSQGDHKYLAEKEKAVPLDKISFQINDTENRNEYLLPGSSAQHLFAQAFISKSRDISGHSNLNPLAQVLSNLPYIVHDIKFLAKQLAETSYARRIVNVPSTPRMVGLSSKAAIQADLDSDWSAYWSQKMGIDVKYHRKNWELCYVTQAFYEAGVLQSSKKGLGFGCGREQLPSLYASLGCKIVATDAPPSNRDSASWNAGNMYTISKDVLFYEKITARETFDSNVELEYVDMNNIGASYNEQFDFCWSICALEHLGSLEKGMDFIKNSLKTLRKGGIAVHTTEYNFTNDDEPPIVYNSTLFQRKHFDMLISSLQDTGYSVATPDYSVGRDTFDGFIDIPPFAGDGIENGVPHLKLSLDGFASTCFGLIIKRLS